jgi:RNA polymerase sigma-70 factor (ECF subfamily)
MSNTDQQLLQQWVQGQDAEAFRALVTRYSTLVFSVSRRVLGNATDAEDAAQECFQALSQAGDAPGNYLGAWLHRVATYHALNKARTAQRLNAREHRYAAAQNEITAPVTWDDLYEHVDAAINELPDHLRLPVVAFYLEQRPQAAIAAELNITRPAVNRRIARGVAHLRATLKKRGVYTTAAALGFLLQANAAEPAPTSLALKLNKLALAGPHTALPQAARAALDQTLATRARWSLRSPWVVAATVTTLVLGGFAAWNVLPNGTAPRTTGPVASAPVQPAASITVATAFASDLEGTATPPPTAPQEPAVVEATGSISGILRDERGAVLADYRVEAYPLHIHSLDRGNPSTWSGSNGAFVFDDVPPGRYFVYAWEEARRSMIPFVRPHMVAIFPTLTQDTVVELVPGEERTGLDLVLRAGPVISGRVRDSAGNPMPDAGVSAEPGSDKSIYYHPLSREVSGDSPSGHAFNFNGERYVGHTDEHGNFKIIGLAQAPYELAFYQQGYRQVSETVDAGTVGLEIVMEKIGDLRIAGRVIDADTLQPIPSFAVGYAKYYDGRWGDLKDAKLRRQVNAADGRFELILEGETGGGLYFAEADGYFRNLASVPSGAVSSTELVIALPRARRVQGRVVNEDGEPVGNAKLFLGRSPNPMFSSFEEEALAEARQDGTFDIAMPAMRAVQLSAGIQKYENDRNLYAAETVTLPATAEDITDLTIRLSREGASVHGTVEFLGQPLRTVVTITQNGGVYSWTGESDAAGTFEIRQLPPMRKAELMISSNRSGGLGPLSPAYAEYTEFRASREVEIASQSSNNLDINFIAGEGRVSGTLRIDGEMAEFGNVYLRITRADGIKQSYWFSEDENGHFVAGGLPAGSGALKVWGRSGETPGQWEVPFTLAPGQALELPCNFSADNALPRPPQDFYEDD